MTQAIRKDFRVIRNGQEYVTEAFSQQGAEQKIDAFLTQQEVQDQISDEQAKSGSRKKIPRPFGNWSRSLRLLFYRCR